jgi:dihydrofolate reductase
VDEALSLARARGDDEVFIAGGADLYAQTMDRWNRLYLTRIGREFPGDTYFPEVDLSGWRLLEDEQHPEAELPHAFLTYER